MTSSSRVSAGVPTGGQFAATSHTEGDVALAAASGPDRAGDIATMDRMLTSYRRVVDATAVAALKGIAADIRTRYPTARYLVTTDTDQGDYDIVESVTDEHGVCVDDEYFDDEEMDGSAWTVNSAMSYVQGDAWRPALAGPNRIDLDKVDRLPAPDSVLAAR